MLNDSTSLDRAFQALVDPVRRGMLAQLSRGPATVSELAAPYPISLPAVMQHLKSLEAGGLVASRKAGRVRTVKLKADVLGEAEGWLRQRREEWSAQLDRFENYVAKLKTEGDQ